MRTIQIRDSTYEMLVIARNELEDTLRCKVDDDSAISILLTDYTGAIV